MACIHIVSFNTFNCHYRMPCLYPRQVCYVSCSGLNEYVVLCNIYHNTRLERFLITTNFKLRYKPSLKLWSCNGMQDWMETSNILTVVCFDLVFVVMCVMYIVLKDFCISWPAEDRVPLIPHPEDQKDVWSLKESPHWFRVQGSKIVIEILCQHFGCILMAL